MKVLVVGSGGREHALVWKLSQSPKVDKIFCAPGNPGMTGLAELVPIGSDDIPALKAFALENSVDLTVVGPEVPLCAGITDEFIREGLLVAGPSAFAAQLEGSKVFSKRIMSKYGVPTAPFRVFEDASQAIEYVRAAGRPLVVKADGLAAGKGVLLCKDAAEAEAAVKSVMIDRDFGAAGDRCLVEEFLEGEEASFLVFTDGFTVIPMPTSQDHKAVGDGDTGPNTGGMGAYSPAPVVTPDVSAKVMEQVITPVLQGMQAEGQPFRGILYAGLMIDSQGDPHVLEFNVRFGDPECQPLLMRLDSDLADILLGLAQNDISRVEVKWSDDPTVCVVLASGGYPGSYEKGKVIYGLDQAAKLPGLVVFHAGTALKDGRIVTSGGRVLGVTARGATIAQAIDKAYQGAELISWDGMYLRKDIGHKALSRSSSSGVKVGILMGSKSDLPVMKATKDTLTELGIESELRVISAHRTPEAAAEYARLADDRGIRILIAGAGWAAHLAGALAAHTALPIIGVPIDSSPLLGLDALLATVQMPPGVPVATMAVGKGGAKNAAVFAAQILALSDPSVATRLARYRLDMARQVAEADREVSEE